MTPTKLRNNSIIIIITGICLYAAQSLYAPQADAAILLIANAAQPVTHLGARDCKKVYQGSSFNNKYLTRLRGIDLPTSSPAHQVFYQHLHLNGVTDTAHKRATLIKVKNQLAAVLLVAHNPQLIAYVDTNITPLHTYAVKSIRYIAASPNPPSKPQTQASNNIAQRQANASRQDTIKIQVRYTQPQFTSLESIANLYGVSVRQLRHWNHLSAHELPRPQQNLIIYMQLTSNPTPATPKNLAAPAQLAANSMQQQRAKLHTMQSLVALSQSMTQP